MRLALLFIVAFGLACGAPAKPVPAPAPQPALSTPPPSPPPAAIGGKEAAPAPEEDPKLARVRDLRNQLFELTLIGPLIEGYERKDWKHWIDADGDCQDTRQEVLIEESEVPVTFKSERNCKVLTGRWTCPYTGEVFTDPRKLDVDHMVPLAAAHAAGGHAWDAERKSAFANELETAHHLIAVKASANRSKGKRPPNEWLPESESYHCEYVQAWLDLKVRWELEVGDEERQFIYLGLAACEFDIRHPECVRSNDPLCGL